MADRWQARPRIVVHVGLSLDGRSGCDRGESSRAFDAALSPSAFEARDRMRRTCQAVMVGINTVVTDDPSLRHPDNPQLIRVVVDSRCRIPLTARIVDGSAPTIVLTSRSAPPSAIQLLQARGVHVLSAGQPQVDLVEGLSNLRREGVRDLLVEGGPTVVGALMHRHLVDELQVLVVPLIVGGDTAPGLIAGRVGHGCGHQFRLAASEVIDGRYPFLRYLPEEAL